MKKYFLQMGSFFLFLIVFVGILSAINYQLIQKYILSPQNFKLQEDVSILMIGDSHLGLSLNPEYIPNSDNKFQIGEPYLYTAARLNYFLEYNPQIKKVVLGFTYSNLDKKKDEELLYNDVSRSFFLGRNFMLLNKDDLKLLHDNKIVYYRNFLGWKLGVPTKDNVSFLIKAIKPSSNRNELPFRGSFFAAQSIGGLDYQKEFQLHFSDTFESSAEINKQYLYYITKLCKEKDVELILYASPLYAPYQNLISNKCIEEYNRIKDDLAIQGVQSWNYTTYNLSDSCFSSANHLNVYGSKIISEIVAKRLQE